jgi:hypothetical protein
VENKNRANHYCTTTSLVATELVVSCVESIIGIHTIIIKSLTNSLLIPHKSCQTNIIKVKTLIASAFESEFLRKVEELVGASSSRISFLEEDFHIMDVSRFAFALNGEFIQGYYEDRFVRWQDGMQWGSRHGMVVPEHMPSGRHSVETDAFMVHFKLHDFSKDAVQSNGRFRNSKLRTKLREKKEGWRGYFLDESDPEELQKLPPQQVTDVLRDWCGTLMARPINSQLQCILPWSPIARFA